MMPPEAEHPVERMNRWADQMEDLNMRGKQARLYRSALPQWPVWLCCFLAIVSLTVNIGSWGTLFFGIMTGWQLALISLGVKASKLEPSDREISDTAHGRTLE